MDYKKIDLGVTTLIVCSVAGAGLFYNAMSSIKDEPKQKKPAVVQLTLDERLASLEDRLKYHPATSKHPSLSKIDATIGGSTGREGFGSCCSYWIKDNKLAGRTISGYIDKDFKIYLDIEQAIGNSDERKINVTYEYRGGEKPVSIFVYKGSFEYQLALDILAKHDKKMGDWINNAKKMLNR